MIWFPISQKTLKDINILLIRKSIILKLFYYIFLFIPLIVFLIIMDILGFIINYLFYSVIFKQTNNMYNDKIFPHMLKVQELLNIDISNAKIGDRFNLLLISDKIWKTLMLLSKKKDKMKTIAMLKKQLIDFPSRKEISSYIKNIIKIVYS